MSTPEYLLVAGSALVVFAASVVGGATVLGRTGRIPSPLQGAIVPGAPEMGIWRRRIYLVVTLAFILISQGILLILFFDNVPRVGSLIIVAEFVLAILITVYVASPVSPKGGH